ncbi:hypothetical protein KR009_008261 [Drosophila setifemur]|nr:hypothetical protein KR009_008261 [Drosophila setifemur]
MRQAHFTSQVLLALTVFYTSLAPAACVYESVILNFLNEFRMRMCHPIPNLGLPALDPLQLKHAQTAVDSKYLVNFTGSIDNFQLHGVSDFYLPTLTLNPVPGLKSTINVTFPNTYFESLYTAKGSLAYILNLAGDGNAETSVKDLSILISFRIRSVSPLAIYSLQIDLHLGDLKISFDNLLEEERINDFIHALVNELGVELLGDIWDYGQDTVVSKVQTVGSSRISKNACDHLLFFRTSQAVNSFLGQYSLSDIIGIITGGGGEEESAPIFEGVEPDCKLEASSSN